MRASKATKGLVVDDADQIMIIKGNKMLVITRRTLADRNLITTFTKLYNK